MKQQQDILACDEFLTIIDSISDGVFAVDKDLNITFLNASPEPCRYAL